MPTSAPQGRGGARHFKKPYVETGLLLKLLKKHEDLLQDLKGYESLSRNSAVDPKALHRCLPLVEDIVALEPSAEVHPQPLRNALLQLLATNPKLNSTRFNGSVWTNMKAERLNVLLSHVRKLARSGGSSCLAALTGSEFERLTETLQKVVLRPEDEAALEKDRPRKQSLNPLEKGRSKSPTPKKRKAAADDVSVDSDGFPKMLASPSVSVHQPSAPSFLRRRAGSHGKQPSEAPEPLHTDLRESMGYLDKGKAQVLKKPASKASAPLQKGGKESDALPKRVPWLKIFKTTGSKPERSYLTGTHDLKEKKRLIIEVTKTRSRQYSFVIDKIKEALEKEPLTKEEAFTLRDKLCAKHP